MYFYDDYSPSPDWFSKFSVPPIRLCVVSGFRYTEVIGWLNSVEEAGFLLGGVDHTAHVQEAAAPLLVDEEEEGPVDGESRRKAGEDAGSASIRAAALVHADHRFLEHLETGNSWHQHGSCAFH